MKGMSETVSTASNAADAWTNPLRDPRDLRLPRIAGPCSIVIVCDTTVKNSFFDCIFQLGYHRTPRDAEVIHDFIAVDRIAPCTPIVSLVDIRYALPELGE